MWTSGVVVVEVDAGDGARGVRPALYLGSGLGLGAGPHRTSPHTTRERTPGGKGLTFDQPCARLCQKRERPLIMLPTAGARVGRLGTAGKGEGERAKEGQSQQRSGDVLS